MSAEILDQPTKTLRPKYLVLAAELRGQIMGGELKVGDRLPSYSAMRTLHGVTPTTVERVHRVLEAEGLLERRHGSGIFVAASTRNIYQLGFLLNRSAQQCEPYWAQLLQGAHSAAASRACQIVLLEAASPVTWEKVDGLIMAGNALECRMPPLMPCVSLLKPKRGVPCVLPDNVGGGRLAARHLLELGHRRIAALTVWHDVQARDRLRGLLQELEAAGVPVDAALIFPIHGDATSMYAATFATRQFEFRRDARERIEEKLSGPWRTVRPTAIFAHNDNAALGVLDALSDAGISVPGDISVIGFDGAGTHLHAREPLTTIELPLHAVGAAGVELLCKQMQGNPTTEKLVLPARMVPGLSTAPVPNGPVGI